jgi:methyl-accepting chemotaxis protein
MVTKGQLDINSSIDGSDELTAISNTLDKTLEALRNAADEGVKSTLIINSMETGVMLVDKDGCINYANNSAKKYADELSKLSKKFSSNNLVGSNFVDIFELAPNFTNEYLSNARGLPLEKTVELAHEFISTRLYAVNNIKGEFSSVLVCFESVTKKIAQANRDRLIKETIEDNIGTLSRSSKELEESAYELTTSVESITSYSQELEQRLTGVSSFTGDMVTDIDQIAEGTRDIMSRTMVLVENNHIVEKIALELSKRSKEVEDVIKFVRDIAEETNLLALNATIEAVRAGEAGKGFAVVANEVKGLAKKTADATEDIQNKVAQIKEATNKTVESITFTNEHIDHINQTISSITSSVDRQSSLTRQIGSDVGSSVTKIQDISKNIETINSKVSENLKQAEEIFGVTGLLSNLR